MKPTVHLVTCAAPPTAAITELIELLQSTGMNVCVIPTVSALEWLDVPAVERLTGHTVSAVGRKPGEPNRMPSADLLIVAPATFNTINKWAHGINDTPTLGVLNGALGNRMIPIIASPYAKPSLAAHPAFQKSLDALTEYGVRLTPTEALRPLGPSQPFQWSVIIDLLGSSRINFLR